LANIENGLKMVLDTETCSLWISEPKNKCVENIYIQEWSSDGCENLNSYILYLIQIIAFNSTDTVQDKNGSLT
jgi:hypothetical protein